MSHFPAVLLELYMCKVDSLLHRGKVGDLVFDQPNPPGALSITVLPRLVEIILVKNILIQCN